MATYTGNEEQYVLDCVTEEIQKIWQGAGIYSFQGTLGDRWECVDTDLATAIANKINRTRKWTKRFQWRSFTPPEERLKNDVKKNMPKLASVTTWEQMSIFQKAKALMLWKVKDSVAQMLNRNPELEQVAHTTTEKDLEPMMEVIKSIAEESAKELEGWDGLGTYEIAGRDDHITRVYGKDQQIWTKQEAADAMVNAVVEQYTKYPEYPLEMIQARKIELVQKATQGVGNLSALNPEDQQKLKQQLIDAPKDFAQAEIKHMELEKINDQPMPRLIEHFQTHCEDIADEVVIRGDAHYKFGSLYQCDATCNKQDGMNKTDTLPFIKQVWKAKEILSERLHAATKSGEAKDRNDVEDIIRNAENITAEPNSTHKKNSTAWDTPEDDQPPVDIYDGYDYEAQEYEY